MPKINKVGRPRTKNSPIKKRTYNKKNNEMTQDNSVIKVENSELTVQQVFDVIAFASNAYGGGLSYGYPQAYTPELVASRLKDVATNPSQADLDKINTALLDPKNNENNLVGYSEFFDLTSILYRRLLHYLSDMLSFNINYEVMNIKDDKEYVSSAFKKDFSKVQDFFYKFDVKQEFRLALKEMIRRETFYSYFRDEGEKFVFQELPRERCKITARWDYGLVFDFDTLWFLQPGVSIDMYPDIFKEMYNKVFRDNPNPMYDPATLISNRDSSWVYWVQTSPEDNFWCFKMNPELITNIPMFAPLFPDLVSQPMIRQLQTNSYIQMAAKMIASSIPYLNKDAKGPVRGDNISITPETLGKFLNILRQGINQVIGVAAMPTEDIKPIEFTGSTEIYDSYNKNVAALSGVNSRLIYSYERQNILETTLSVDVDKYLMKPVYGYFENFLNYYINNKITGKYKFKFTLCGTEFSNEKDSELNDAIKLANLGIILPQKFSNALNLTPWGFQKQLDEARVGGFVDKLTPILMAAQTPAGGRPQKEVDKLNDSDTRDAGSNMGKGGKI
jgi:hypothetical protein